MSNWDRYPLDYRHEEIQAILAAVQAGECFSLVGLSGSGKSNLIGFLAHRYAEILTSRPIANWPPLFYMLDCNRFSGHSTASFLRFICTALDADTPVEPQIDEYSALDSILANQLRYHSRLCLLFDRFDSLSVDLDKPDGSAIFALLRGLRDQHKYALTYVITTRKPQDPHTELSELFFAHTIWLGPLQESDARWSVQEYARRLESAWDEAIIQKIIHLSGAYPSLLRAVCEAFAAGAALDVTGLKANPAIARRLEEFWADHPDDQALRNSRLEHIELLSLGPKPLAVDATQLTAKENLLWQYLLHHPGEVCSKDDLIRAVWPEDRIYGGGIRDDSLAQLVRRLREKIEVDPSNPRHLQTVPGRGYCYLPG